jgi:hypothetical protein
MNPRGEFPEEEGPLGVPDGVCVGVGIEAFNAQYLGGSVGDTRKERCADGGLTSHCNPDVNTRSVCVVDHFYRDGQDVVRLWTFYTRKIISSSKRYCV